MLENRAMLSPSQCSSGQQRAPASTNRARHIAATYAMFDPNEPRPLQPCYPNRKDKTRDHKTLFVYEIVCNQYNLILTPKHIMPGTVFLYIICCSNCTLYQPDMRHVFADCTLRLAEISAFDNLIIIIIIHLI